MTTILTLPMDILLLIVDNLNLKDYLATLQTCKLMCLACTKRLLPRQSIYGWCKHGSAMYFAIKLNSPQLFTYVQNQEDMMEYIKDIFDLNATNIIPILIQDLNKNGRLNILNKDISTIALSLLEFGHLPEFLILTKYYSIKLSSVQLLPQSYKSKNLALFKQLTQLSLIKLDTIAYDLDDLIHGDRLKLTDCMEITDYLLTLPNMVIDFDVKTVEYMVLSKKYSNEWLCNKIYDYYNTNKVDELVTAVLAAIEKSQNLELYQMIMTKKVFSMAAIKEYLFNFDAVELAKLAPIDFNGDFVLYVIHYNKIKLFKYYVNNYTVGKNIMLCLLDYITNFTMLKILHQSGFRFDAADIARVIRLDIKEYLLELNYDLCFSFQELCHLSIKSLKLLVAQGKQYDNKIILTQIQSIQQIILLEKLGITFEFHCSRQDFSNAIKSEADAEFVQRVKMAQLVKKNVK